MVYNLGNGIHMDMVYMIVKHLIQQLFIIQRISMQVLIKVFIKEILIIVGFKDKLTKKD